MALLVWIHPDLIAQQRSAMAQAIEDFGNRNLQPIRNQSHTIGGRSRLACPDVGSDMMMVTAGSKEQRTRVCALCHGKTQEFTEKSLCSAQVVDVKMDVSEVDLHRRLSCPWFGGGQEVFQVKRG